MRRLHHSPILLFLQVLLIVFLVEAVVMIILPYVLPLRSDGIAHALVDAALLNVLSAPLLWWSIIGPLRRAATSEHVAAIAQLGTAFAHRLRNPLTSLKMLVQAGSRQETLLTLTQEDLQFMEDSVRRMERSLQMFLDFAQPKQLQRRKVALATVLAEAVAAAQTRAASKRVQIACAPADADGEIEADPQQLSAALQHLLQNAIDASPAEGRVDVDCATQLAGEVEIRIRDGGPGIPAPVLAQLFEPFVTTKATGAGLGLVIARRIAQDHGGYLSVTNRVEGGSCSVLRLPR